MITRISLIVLCTKLYIGGTVSTDKDAYDTVQPYING